MCHQLIKLSFDSRYIFRPSLLYPCVASVSSLEAPFAFRGTTSLIESMAPKSSACAMKIH